MAYANYWSTGYDGAGTFPPVRSLILSPRQNLASAKTVTALSGTPAAAYPLVNATDGTMQTVARIAETSGVLVVDLGASHIPTIAALFGHNIDDGLVVGLRGSNNASLAAPVVTIGFEARPIGAWVDLRGFSFAAARYWGFEIEASAPNSQPWQVGEFVLGVPETFEGIVDPDHEVETRFFSARELSEYEVLFEAVSGAMHRQVRLNTLLGPESRPRLEAIYDDAGTTGGRVFVAVDSRSSDCFWIDWPERRETGYEKTDLFPTIAMMLTEESPGVV